MYKRMLFILSTLALLIYPLSVSAQSSFSLSLDVNSAAGDQAITSLNTSADQVIAIQIFGNRIQNANALAVRFEYDASQVTYDGFDVGSVLPNAQALPEQGTNPTFVEIGIASLGGQATANSGLVGTIRFRATAAFSGTSIRLARAELSRGGQFETITPNIRIELLTPPAPTNFFLSLDADGATGDQAVTSLDVSTDQVVAIQIFGTDIQNANGVSVRFEYNAAQVTYDGFDVGNVLPSAQALPEHGTNPTFVQIGIVSFGGQATANSGLMGTIRFRTTGTFSGTAIRLARAELSRGGRFETITPNIRIELQTPPAPTNFSLSLDADGATGDQSVTSFNTSADQVIAIQIFGTDIQNANGVSMRFEYDTSQVTYDGFDAGSVLPSAQALPEHGTTFVEIGIVSLGGQATVNSGLIGTIRFRATAAFSGATIQLVRAELSRGGRFETITPNIRVELQSAPASANFSLSLDADGATDDQSVTSLDVSVDQVVAIQIFGTDIQNANGVSMRFEYDASQVTYDGFDAGSVLPSAQALPEHGTNPTFVQIGIVSFGGQATVNSGLVGTIRFRTTATFSGASIRLVRAELGRGGRFETITPNIRIELQLQALTPDFDGDGRVGFSDFLLFGSQFGARQGDGRYEARFDLDSDGAIGFGDFLIFGSDFGKEVSSGSGGSGGSGSPDLIVESPSVSDSTLTAGQSFTLQATVRNQGSGQAAATTLRYYQSSDAIITVNDTQVGTDAIGSLNASGTSAESISLNAPSRAGTYYYGACVEQVEGEPEIDNNCSDAVRVSVSSGTGLVAIPDENLRAVIEAALNKASGAPITQAEMASLTRLNAERRGISDLTGLEFATGLTELYLSYENLISDVSALAGMTKLETLWLNDNVITDISALAGATNLTYLYLNDNLISDVSALAGMNKLTDLRLDNNVITDVSALAGATNLTYLYLNENAISDVSVLTGMTKLETLWLNDNLISDVSALAGITNLTDLRLDNNVVSDVSALTGLTRLEWLGLSNNLISDVSALSGMTSLTNLYLRGNTILSISPLANLTRLKELVLWENAISDVSALSGMTNLTYLDLDQNTISSISPLAGMINLEYLFLSENLISNISPLANLTNLTRMDIYSNNLSNISPLANLTNLTYLDLDQNTISSISPLAGMTNLEYLFLSENLISNISPLANLTNLTVLWLNSNAISDISLLSGLTNLERLLLYNNAISDISPLLGMINVELLVIEANLISDLAPLVANPGLGSGDEVYVKDNPLNATSINTHIPALQGRGVTVEFNLPPAAPNNLTATAGPGYVSLVWNNPNDANITGYEYRVSSNPPTYGDWTAIPNSSANTTTHTVTGLTGGTMYTFQVRAVSRHGNSSASASVSATPHQVVTVTIPDTNLRAVIADSLGKASGATITSADMAILTRLDAPDKNISDLTGLEFATGLIELELGKWDNSNSISDLSPLAGLTNLTSLGLGGNRISDLSPLSGLTNLTRLELSNNNISDLSPLSGLTNLTTLWLPSNSISDISPLANLTKIWQISFHGNTISDLSPLANMIHLSTLILTDNIISDISPLSGLTSLRELHLNGNSISDLAPLSNADLTNLKWLVLSNNSISDLTPLVANMGLDSGDNVDVRNNPLSNTSINTHIPALQYRGVTVQFDLPPDPTPVTIADANLRTVLEIALEKASGVTITRGDMSTLTYLEARNKNIRDLTGLEYATNLQTLDLGSAWGANGLVNSNAISDFSALSSLTNLTWLDLDSNGISNLSALVSAISGLTNLQTLVLSNNNISAISALSSLTNLTRLNLGGELDSWSSDGVNLRLDDNTISDISPLSSLTNLTWLNLSGNDISDISLISSLTNLQSLNLSGNDISDFSPLSSLTNLTDLTLINTTISNHLSSLSSLTSLTHLNLAGNTLSDLSPLRSLTSLTSLRLFVTTISDVSALSNLTSLTNLNLSYNSISDISALSNLTKLTRLELGINSISDISVLAGLTSLESLSLRSNSISDISALSSLNNLTWLSIDSNSISDISVLADLTNLTGLNSGNNSISDISALSSLTRLESLYLWNNSISDISPLSNLTNLRWLNLSNNNISDLAPLVSNTGLGSGDEVNVRNNPLSPTSINTHIPTLQGRGVTVQFGTSKPTIDEIAQRMPRVVMNGLKGVAGKHRDDLLEQGVERAYLYKGMQGTSVRLEWNPSADDGARRMPRVLTNGSPNSTVEKELRHKPHALMKGLEGIAGEHRDDLLEQGAERAYFSKGMKDAGVRWEWKPAIGEKETRMPSKPVVKENERLVSRAAMKPYGVGAREEAEYMSRRWMEMGEDVISRKTGLRDKARREIRNTPKTDARDRRRMEMRQEMISRKESLRAKAKREAR